MIRLPPDFREFLRLLNSHRVEYLLIGGLDDLKVNKKASGRHKDLADLESLEPPADDKPREMGPGKRL